eukprot:jgi/Hompol1/4132/HPOL_003478-RA
MDYNYAINRLTTNVVRTLKAKHIQVLISCTHHDDVSMSDLFRALTPRLKESNWIVVFKALTIIHVLIKEGNSDRTIGYLAANPDKINMTGFKDRTGHPIGSIQTKNIKSYASYLEERAACFKDIKIDWISSKDAALERLRNRSIDDGFLQDISILQRQVDSILGCSWLVEDLDQVITLQAYRLIVWDMMALFHLLNEAIVRLLGLYFELDRVNAARGLEIYKKFAKEIKKIVEFFDTARRVSREMGIDIPTFTHPPVSLAVSLEEYLRSPDFEAQRAAYKQRKAVKAGGRIAKTH